VNEERFEWAFELVGGSVAKHELSSREQRIGFVRSIYGAKELHVQMNNGPEDSLALDQFLADHMVSNFASKVD
jgi:hypothetical protein